jgi:hypothetical protein
MMMLKFKGEGADILAKANGYLPLGQSILSQMMIRHEDRPIQPPQILKLYMEWLYIVARLKHL